MDLSHIVTLGAIGDDGLHPTDSGYEQLAAAYFSAIRGARTRSNAAHRSSVQRHAARRLALTDARGRHARPRRRRSASLARL